MNSLTLKIIGTILMIIDHLGMFFPTVFPVIFRLIGRLSAPIFFFLLVEGYRHTHNIMKYIKNTSIISIIILIINTIFSLFNNSIPISGIEPNIMLTFSFCLYYLLSIDRFLDKKNIMNFIFIIICIIGICFSEGGIISLFLITFFNFMPKITQRKSFYIIGYLLGSIIFSFIFSTNIQFLMSLSIVFIMLYNGKRGPNNRAIKYFFYLFYPIHLFIFSIIYIIFF